MKGKFWNDKGLKCKKCGAVNMSYWVKMYKQCGNCGNKIKEQEQDK